MSTLRHIVHSLFRMTGYDFLRYSKENFVSIRRAHILHTENINLVLDVGANEGAYGQEIRRSSYRGRILSFEPLAQAFETLQKQSRHDPLWECMNMALGEFDGETRINISGHQTSSSLLPISEHHIRAKPSSAYVGKETVKILRLDSLLNNGIFPKERIYLKVDVQGYERRVLQGAAQTLKQTRAVEIELSMAAMYEGSPMYYEMIDYLEGQEFGLVSIEKVFSDPQTGYMLQADGIFVRRSLSGEFSEGK